MARNWRRWFAAAALAVLAGCSWTSDLEALRAAEADGVGKVRADTFSRALAGEYLAFAVFEADEMYDWIDSRHFARKGRRAAAGAAVAPEVPSDWNLPRALRPVLADGHERLVAALAAGARGRSPDLAARAQAMFDCWLEQQEENWQTDHIATCRNGFETALGALARRSNGPRRFQLFFAFDRAALDSSALSVLAALAAEARRGTGPVRLAGHADRAGAAAYNLELSRRRALAVRAALVRAGIGTARVRVEALGENLPLVPTPDGTREARNRRVEAVIDAVPSAGPHAAR
ncbi:MAG: OmpA family protein [Alphaproteobacteria bacterium]